MKKLLLALLCGACLASPASAECQNKAFTFCSMNFHAGTACTGQDQVILFVRPWEPFTIKIVGVEIVMFENPQTLQYAFAGNNWTPDIMLMLGKGTSHGVQMFPAPYGFELPAKGVDEMAYVDLHINCQPIGVPVQFFYNIYYVTP